MNQFQKQGIIAYWTINRTHERAMWYLRAQGYGIIDEIVWIKLSRRDKLHAGLGHYARHAKETCLLAKKGLVDLNYKTKLSNVSFEK